MYQYNDIKSVVFQYYDVTQKDVFQKNEVRHPVSIARNMLTYLCRIKLGMTYKELADLFQVTVRCVQYRMSNFGKLMRTNKSVQRDIDEVIKLLKTK